MYSPVITTVTTLNSVWLMAIWTVMYLYNNIITVCISDCCTVTCTPVHLNINMTYFFFSFCFHTVQGLLNLRRKD